MVHHPTLLPLTYMARRLRVPPAWLRAEAEAGRLPHLKADTAFLFDPDLVERLLTERSRCGLKSTAVDPTADIPREDEIRRRLAVVLTEADLLRSQLRVSKRIERERKRLRQLSADAEQVSTEQIDTGSK